MARKDKLVNHEENRKRICIFCLSKDGRGNKFRKITSKGQTENMVNKHFRYNANDSRLPNGICNGCRTKLLRVKNGQAVDIPNLSQFYVSKIHTRSTVVSKDGICDCNICKTVRTPILKKDEENSEQRMFMSIETIWFTSKQFVNTYYLTGKPRKGPEFLKLCSYCYSIINPGRSHSCNQSTRATNLSSIIQDSLTTGERDQIISTLLRNKVNEVGKPGDNQEISIATLTGKPIRVIVNPTSQSDRTDNFTISDIQNIQANYNFTQNETLGIASWIRTSSKNRKAIEPNLKEHIRADLRCLDQFFDVQVSNFKHKKKTVVTNVEESVVYCKELRGFIDYVKQKRLVNRVHLKLGIDGGGGSLKICLSIQSLEDNNAEPKHSRQKYEDGAAAKRFLDTGVKRLFIIALACVQENYENVSWLWSLIGLKNFEGSIATDLKLANILAGLMCHSSTYPCTYCVAKSGELQQDAECRTVGDILQNYLNWQEGGGTTSTAKQYMNCVNPPIISDKKDDLILDLIPPPELHLMLGVVNTLFDHRSRNTTRKQWHGLILVMSNVKPKKVDMHSTEMLANNY